MILSSHQCHKIKKKTHKYGLEIPTSVADALRIDRENGNNLWGEAISKEMTNVAVSFDILEVDQPIPDGWSKSSGHIIFDIKMDFTRKSRWVKDGHLTEDPLYSTYAGVVSRESV